MFMTKIAVESQLDSEEFDFMSFNFKNDSPVVGSMVRSGCHVNEISFVMLGFVSSEGFVNTGVDELLVVFLLAEGKHEFPVSFEFTIVFKMN